MRKTRAGQATDGNMAHEHYMMDTNIHSEYVILIAFPLQQWLHKRASLLRYTYIGCLSCYTSHTETDESALIASGSNSSSICSNFLFLNTTVLLHAHLVTIARCEDDCPHPKYWATNYPAVYRNMQLFYSGTH